MKTIIINNPGEVDIIEQAMPVRKQGEALLKYYMVEFVVVI